MLDEKEERIRAEAYRRWEQEGRPEGQHDRHWHEAADAMSDGKVAALESEGATQALKVLKPAAAKPKAEKTAAKPKAAKPAGSAPMAEAKATKAAAAKVTTPASIVAETPKRTKSSKPSAVK